MKQIVKSVLFCFVLTTLLFACDGPVPPESVEIDSSDTTVGDDTSTDPGLNIIATDVIHFYGDVILTSSFLSVSVTLRLSGEDIELTGGDQLVVNTGGGDIVLIKHVSHSTSFSPVTWSFVTTTHVVYLALIPFADVYSDTVLIKFLRPNTQDAINTTVTIPPAINIQSPQEGQIYSRSVDDIIVEWSNPQVMHDVDIDAYKFLGLDDWSPLSFEFNDDGVDDIGLYTIAANSIVASSIDIENQAIELDISVTRVAFGSVDGNFNQGSGSIKAFNKSTVTISSVP